MGQAQTKVPKLSEILGLSDYTVVFSSLDNSVFVPNIQPQNFSPGQVLFIGLVKDLDLAKTKHVARTISLKTNKGVKVRFKVPSDKEMTFEITAIYPPYNLNIDGEINGVSVQLSKNKNRWHLTSNVPGKKISDIL